VGSRLDAALEARLELVQSKKHNDLLLRCVVPTQQQQSPPAEPVTVEQPWVEERVDRWCDAEDDDESTAASSAGSELQKELEQLRCENERLRSQNCFLEKQQAESAAKPQLWALDDPWELDDPFEPPPTQYTQYWSSAPSPAFKSSAQSPVSTAAPSEFCMSSCSTPYARSSQGSCATPFSQGSCSGAATPIPQVAPQGMLLMPMPMTWFSMGDLGQIPSGVVQKAKAVYEQHAVIPSFFVQQ